MSIPINSARVASEWESVKASGLAIASAITSAGGTVSAGDGFADFAGCIGTIPTLGGASSGSLPLGTNYGSSIPLDVYSAIVGFIFAGATAFGSAA